MNDKWFRLVGIPVVATVVYLSFDGLPRFGADGAWKDFAFGLLITTAMWEGNRTIFLAMRRRYPRYEHTARRLVLQALASVAFTVMATLLLNELHRLVLHAPLRAPGSYLVTFLLQLVPTFMMTSTYESVYFFGEWKKHFRRADALVQASIQSQLEALQRQLDPHFLFNSLNTLAALIEPDNHEAQRFVERLADVYRYVLLSRDRPTVPLAEELKFVAAYVALHKTRFGDDLDVQAPPPDPDLLARAAVAPLSVQMLIENALKHNIIAPHRPLLVTLCAADGYVSVRNNLQPRATLPQSTHVGLQNIVERYRLLTDRPVQVLREAGHFTVRLPLLPR